MHLPLARLVSPLVLVAALSLSPPASAGGLGHPWHWGHGYQTGSIVVPTLAVPVTAVPVTIVPVTTVVGTTIHGGAVGGTTVGGTVTTIHGGGGIAPVTNTPTLVLPAGFQVAGAQTVQMPGLQTAQGATMQPTLMWVAQAPQSTAAPALAPLSATSPQAGIFAPATAQGVIAGPNSPNTQALVNTRNLQGRLRDLLRGVGQFGRDQLLPFLLENGKSIFLSEIGRLPGDSEFRVIEDIARGLLDERLGGGSSSGGIAPVGGGGGAGGASQVTITGPVTISAQNVNVEPVGAVPPAPAPAPAPAPSGTGPTPPPAEAAPR